MLSLLVFTGASQFAFIGIIASGGNPVTGALTAVLLGSRNLFYGLSLAQKLNLKGPQRLASAHFVIDESTAMAVTRETTRQTPVGVLLDRHLDLRAVEPHDVRRRAGRRRRSATPRRTGWMPRSVRRSSACCGHV